MLKERYEGISSTFIIPSVCSLKTHWCLGHIEYRHGKPQNYSLKLLMDREVWDDILVRLGLLSLFA